MFFRKEEVPKDDQQNFTSLADFPRQELYRLVVDGDYHKSQNGWVGYENREPGCLEAFFDALQFINQNDDEPLSVEYIQTIHFLVDRFDKRDTRFTASPPGHFREIIPLLQHASVFGLSQKCSSVMGLTEFLDEMESDPNYHKFTISFKENDHKYEHVHRKNIMELKQKYGVNTNGELAQIIYDFLKNEGGRFSSSYSVAEIYKMIQEAIHNYYDSVKKLQNTDDKLKAMVKLVQFLERLHPFSDRNIRTFILLTLMKLMKQNNMIVPLFTDPNKFDMHSSDEAVQMIKDGMELTRKVMKGEAVFDFDTDTMSQEQKDKFKEISKVFSQNPSPEKLQEYENIFYQFKLLTLKKEIEFKVTDVLEPLAKFVSEKYSSEAGILEKKNEGDCLATQFFTIAAIAKALGSESDTYEIVKIIDKSLTDIVSEWDVPEDIHLKISFHDLLKEIKPVLEKIDSIRHEIAENKEAIGQKFT